jgi:hypothetical protein
MQSAQEGLGALGVLTSGTNGWCKAESGGGGRRRASRSGCEGGGKRLRAGAERGGAGGAVRARNRTGIRQRRRIAVGGGRRKKRRWFGLRVSRGEKNAPVRERGVEEGGASAGWRRPAATLAQPAADGVAMPPRLANRRRRAASRWGRGG